MDKWQLSLQHPCPQDPVFIIYMYIFKCWFWCYYFNYAPGKAGINIYKKNGGEWLGKNGLKVVIIFIYIHIARENLDCVTDGYLVCWG